jgi:DNA-binding MarR family transcriptional regulator
VSADGESEHETAADAADDSALLQAIVGIRALMLAGQQFRRAVADHFGVGLSEASAANHLAILGPMAPSQLADRVGLTPSSVTALLDRLVRADLATRSAHATDRRQNVITLTPRGAAMQSQVQQWIRSALADLDQARLEQTVIALTDLATALGAQAIKIGQLTPADEG